MTVMARVAVALAPRGSVTWTPTPVECREREAAQRERVVPPSNSYVPLPSRSNAKWSGSPSGSLEPPASNVAGAPTSTCAGAVSAAAGGAFGTWRETNGGSAPRPARRVDGAAGSERGGERRGAAGRRREAAPAGRRAAEPGLGGPAASIPPSSNSCGPRRGPAPATSARRRRTRVRQRRRRPRPRQVAPPAPKPASGAPSGCGARQREAPGEAAAVIRAGAPIDRADCVPLAFGSDAGEPPPSPSKPSPACPSLNPPSAGCGANRRSGLDPAGEHDPAVGARAIASACALNPKSTSAMPRCRTWCRAPRSLEERAAKKMFSAGNARSAPPADERYLPRSAGFRRELRRTASQSVRERLIVRAAGGVSRSTNGAPGGGAVVDTRRSPAASTRPAGSSATASSRVADRSAREPRDPGPTPNAGSGAPAPVSWTTTASSMPCWLRAHPAATGLPSARVVSASKRAPPRRSRRRPAARCRRRRMPDRDRPGGPARHGREAARA